MDRFGLLGLCWICVPLRVLCQLRFLWEKFRFPSGSIRCLVRSAQSECNVEPCIKEEIVVTARA